MLNSNPHHQRGKTSNHRITATSTTPGNPKDQESYRSERFGILHAVMIIEKFYTKYNILELEMTVACDGLETIRIAMDRSTTLSSKYNHFFFFLLVRYPCPHSVFIIGWWNYNPEQRI